jgi:hypothetical protein
MKQEILFKSRLIPAEEGSGKLFKEEYVPNNSPGKPKEGSEAERGVKSSFLTGCVA